MKQRRILRLLALVGVLTLIGAACSNDDGGSSGDSGSTGASGGGVDCSTVEFGCVEVRVRTRRSRSGRSWPSAGTPRRLGDGQPGWRHAGHRLPGRDVRREHGRRSSSATPSNCPTRTTCARAEGGQAGATKLAADPSIVAVIGTSCSSAALGVADKILSDKGMLLISPSNTNPGPDGPRRRTSRSTSGRRTTTRSRAPSWPTSCTTKLGRRPRRHDPRREPVRRRRLSAAFRDELRGGGRNDHGRPRRSTARTPTSSRC